LTRVDQIAWPEGPLWLSEEAHVGWFERSSLGDLGGPLLFTWVGYYV
jgi:hypothetical protein